MSKPEESNTPKPEEKSLADAFKNIDLTAAEEKIKSEIRGGLIKGFAFARKAKAALTGDEAAKKELTDAASDALAKGSKAIESTEEFLGEVREKAQKKIEDLRKPK